MNSEKDMTTKVRGCSTLECFNNTHKGKCKLLEIEIGIHPESRKIGCMQFKFNFQWFRTEGKRIGYEKYIKGEVNE